MQLALIVPQLPIGRLARAWEQRASKRQEERGGDRIKVGGGVESEGKERKKGGGC